MLLLTSGSPSSNFCLCEIFAPEILFSFRICCDFFPQLSLRIARFLISSVLQSRSGLRVDAPVQSIRRRRPQHFCFVRTELIPSQSRVQALSTSFEKTCKSRLRGEFFQDVVLAAALGSVGTLCVSSDLVVLVAGARLGTVLHVNKRSRSCLQRSPQSKKNI